MDKIEFTELEEESRPQLVDRLLLHIRTNNFDAFCSAVDKGYLYFGQDKLAYIMRNDLMKKLFECNEVDNFIAWAEKFEDV